MTEHEKLSALESLNEAMHSHKAAALAATTPQELAAVKLEARRTLDAFERLFEQPTQDATSSYVWPI